MWFINTQDSSKPYTSDHHSPNPSTCLDYFQQCAAYCAATHDADHQAHAYPQRQPNAHSHEQAHAQPFHQPNARG